MNQMIVKCYHYMKEDEIDEERLVLVLLYNGITTADVCLEFNSYGSVIIHAGLSYRAVNTPIERSYQAANIAMQTVSKFGGKGCGSRDSIISAFRAQGNTDEYSLGYMVVDPALY